MAAVTVPSPRPRGDARVGNTYHALVRNRELAQLPVGTVLEVVGYLGRRFAHSRSCGLAPLHYDEYDRHRELHLVLVKTENETVTRRRHLVSEWHYWPDISVLDDDDDCEDSWVPLADRFAFYTEYLRRGLAPAAVPEAW